MREISAAAYDKLQEDLKVLDKELAEIEVRLQTALGFGDLSENNEYEAEKANMTQKQTLKMEIEQILRTSKPKQGYSNYISAGTLINVREVDKDGKVLEDLGLLMFDEVGDIFFDGKITSTTKLGSVIQGTTGGTFQIQDRGGNTLYFEVKVEVEGKLDEFMRKYSMNRNAMLEKLYTDEATV